MLNKHKTLFASLAVFLITALMLSLASAITIDRSLTLTIYGAFHQPFATVLFSFITNYTLGDIVGPAIILLYLLYKRRITLGAAYGISALLLAFVRHTLQLAIGRPRPFELFPHIIYLGGTAPTAQSFPSGHATMAFFVAVFVTRVLRLSKTKAWLLYTLAFLVALSRVYLGAHFVLDVVAGAALGIFWAEGSLYIMRTSGVIRS